MNATLCSSCPPADWIGQNCSDVAWSCACFTTNTTDVCVVHGSAVIPAFFAVITAIEAIVFLANLVLCGAVLYLYNKEKQFRFTIVNIQFLVLVVALALNLASLPGSYGSWAVWGASIDAVTIANILLAVQINVTVIAMLLGYLYWLELVLTFTRKALIVDTSKIGKMRLLRKPTIAVLSIIVIATISMSILRLVAYQGADEQTLGSTLAAVSNFVDLAVVVIMTVFVVFMFVIGVWFLTFLSKQDGEAVKASVIKGSQTHIGSCVILILFQVLKLSASLNGGFVTAMVLRVIADALFLCGIPTIATFVHRNSLRKWQETADKAVTEDS